MTRLLTPLFLLFVLLAPLHAAQAASEAVQIHLHRGFNGTQYIVPAGKVLLVEYVNFNETWQNSGDPLELIVQASLNPSGPVWNSRFRFYSGANALPRVLRVPAGRALLAPYDNNILHKIFIYGVMVDASSQVLP